MIGDGITSIGNYAFNGYNSLQNVDFGDAEITRIGDYAFYNCHALTSVTIPDSVIIIGNQAFNNCGSIESVTIPDSVTNIGIRAFNGCSALVSVTIGSGVIITGEGAFGQCSHLESVTIRHGVTNIGEGAFENCPALVSVTIPGSVITISDRAFQNTALTSVTIPDSVTTIGGRAFQNTALTSVTIPDSVTTIDAYAFYNCPALTRMVFDGDAPTMGSEWAAFSTNLVAYYREEADGFTTPEWEGVPCYPLGPTVTEKSPTGDGVAVDENVIVTFSEAMDIESVRILIDGVVGTIDWDGNTATFTPNSDFAYGTQYTVTVNGRDLEGNNLRGTTWTFATVGEVPSAEFNYIYDGSGGIIITSYKGSGGDVVIPDAIGGKSVTGIGESAFSYCNALTSVTIPDSVTSIGESAFDRCTSLTSVTIGSSVYIIGPYAFDNCTALTSVTIPNSVNTIGASAFNYCTRLTSVTIGSNVDTIGDWAFLSTALTSVTIPNSVTSIGQGAFSNCTSIESATIGSDVDTIGDWAFYYCSALTRMVFEGNAPMMGNNWAAASNNLVVYYREGATGFITPEWEGVPCYLFGVTVPTITEKSPTGDGVVIDAKVIITFSEAMNESSVSIIINGVTGTIDWDGNTATFTPNSDFNYNNSYTVTVNGKDLEGIDLRETIWTFVTASIEFDYRDDGNGGIIITHYSGENSDVVIPDTINGKPVTGIDDQAFEGRDLTSVTIPNSVTSIGNQAFNGCSALTSVTILDSVTTIGEGAFDNCTALESVTIGSSVITIGRSAFNRCTSLTSVTIPDSVTTIGERAFNGCIKLTSVTIPNSVTSIGGSAFSGCIALESVTIGSSVMTIGDWAFQGCTSLTSVTIPNSVTSMGISVFNGCIKLTSVTIGSGVDTIGESVFNGCIALESVTIPNNVITIGVYAFEGCTALGSVTIGSSVITIDGNAFEGCTALESVTIPNSVTTIGVYAFNDCTALESVTIGSSVMTIGERAFHHTALTSVTIPNSVTIIGSYAFYDCNALTSVTIGSGVDTIGDNAFYYCPALTRMVFDGDAPNTGHGWAASSNNLVVYYREGATGFTIPTWAGVSCQLLDVTAPTITGMSPTGDGAAVDANVIVTFSEAMDQDSVSIVIGGVAGSIIAWNGNTATFKPNSDLDYDTEYTVTVNGKDGALNDLEETTWMFVTVEYDPSVEFDYVSDGYEIIIIGYTGSGGDVVIPGIIDGKPVTGISDWAFLNHTLISAIIPDSVTSIGEHAFHNCIALTSVTIGRGVDTIGSYAFNNCTALESVIIPDSVTSIGESAFSGCTRLTSVTISSGVESIGSYAFNNCTALESVIIPDSVTSIGRNAFSGCVSLTSVTISSGIITIDEEVFKGCIALTSVTIPDNVASINYGAFYDCASLTSVTIGSGVDTIGDYVFHGCTSASILFKGNAPETVGDYWAEGADGLRVYYHKGATGFGTEPEGNWKGVPYSALAIDIATAVIPVISSYEYTGVAITPELVITLGEKTLTVDLDYEIAYGTNVDVATGGTVTIKGIGNYGGSVVKNFTITAKDIEGADVDIAYLTTEYTGVQLKPGVTSVTLGVKTLAADDYEIVYSANVNVGTATVTINGKGNYTGSVKMDFAITAKNISEATVDAIYAESWTGEEIEPLPTVTLGRTLVNGTDYTVVYADNVAVGTATLTINGKGNYTGTVAQSVTFDIKKGIADTTVDEITDRTYTGDEIEPVIVVRDGTTVLALDAHYTVVYSDNINAGKATVTITGIGNYTGSVKMEFTITAKDIDGADVDIAYQTAVYTGDQMKPGVTSVTLGVKTLAADDYEIVYGENVDVATGGTVTINGKGNYTGSVEKTFTITVKDITSTATAEVAGGADLVYSGSAKAPALVVMDGTIILALDTDYTVNYGVNNTNVGEVTATVTFKGNYAGTKDVIFAITAKNISSTATAEVAEDADLVYSGTAKTPALVVMDGTTVLALETDYTVNYGVNNTNAGEVTATVTFKGNYAGTKNAVFTIAAKNISDAVVVLDDDTAEYTGSAIEVDVGSVTLGLAVLDEDDYDVSYSANTNVGTATVTVTGKGNYAGTATATFTIFIDDDGMKDLIENEAKPVFRIEQGSAADLEIGSSVFQELAEAGKTLTVDVTDDEGNVMYSWVFDGEYDEGVTGTFKAGISVVDPDEDLLAAITSAGAENPFVLDFAASGTLPVNATVKCYVGENYEPGATLNLFFYNEDTGKLEAMDQDLVVDADGFVTFSPPHFSMYVLAESIPGSASDGSSDNLMIYVAVIVVAVILAVIVATVILRKK